MKSTKDIVLLIALISLVAVGTVTAAEVLVTDNIATSTVWTADNTYNLQKQIYVFPGATLTIEPGTIIASTPTTDGAGSLAVCRGGRLYANGTARKPIIMTSTNDDFKNWREACNEWGNLTIMGNGLISSYKYGGVVKTYKDGYDASGVTNTALLDGVDKRVMEGLTADAEGDPKVLYGGNDDDDNSGSISYLSIRYGGRVVGLTNELNGLSLGGIGRETDIHHIDIMNNVDDGIEIWGGTVNLKYVNIWNVGDDSFDVDQGWRGKAQYVLVVQGHSADASQGSGVGDNAFEMDGAEDSDAQPVTTIAVYNATVIGQPMHGDHGTAWRDNARAQFRNCIFMDLGEQLIKKDNVDGDGGQGYGYNGTLSWESTWTSSYAEAWNNSNSYTGGHGNANGYTADQLQAVYPVQTSGNLSEISDSVFYRNLFNKAYTDYSSLSALSGSNNINNIVATEMPIKDIVRVSEVQTKGGLNMVPVIYIDPRAANDAVTSISAAPADGFFTPAQYRGAFNAYDNWLEGWTAAYQYGMTGVQGDITGDEQVNMEDLGVLSENWLF
ncbi:MAG: hypothetical protein JXB18_06150 [Sedimentisphaerales bacterium]|nr:hypothetical protein [Sedimentisphaerales bacterium]